MCVLILWWTGLIIKIQNNIVLQENTACDANLFSYKFTKEKKYVEMM